MKSYGFLGLGIMGRPMAANLIQAGFDVTVWNRSPEKCAPLVDLGARQGESPRAVAESCDITLAMLADPAAAKEVFFGSDGVREGLAFGRGYVDMSTVDDTTSCTIAKAVAECGGRFLEAPVSGTKKPAEDGTLIILAAGDRTLYDEVGPAFNLMSKMHVYLGETGQGARMKLVVNMVMGEMMVALCEGLAMARKAGLDPDQLLEVLDTGALANPLFRIKGSMIQKGDYSTNFPLKHMQKDLRLAVALGDKLNQSLHGAATANETFIRARAIGCADEDISAVFKSVD